MPMKSTPGASTPSHDPLPRRPRPWIRLAILSAVLVTLLLVGEAFGVREWLTIEWLEDTVEAAGPWGYLVFLATFAAGELLHVPGLVFVSAAILAYGRIEGGLIAYVGALTSVTVVFILVRAGGGQALAEIERPWLRRMMSRLDAHPIRIVVLLRLVLWLAPPVNYALALSSIRTRDYIIGSAVGLVPVVFAVALLLGR